MKLKALITATLVLALSAPIFTSCKKESRSHRSDDDDDQIENVKEESDEYDSDKDEIIKELKAEFDAVNEQCPKRVDEITIIKKVDFRHNTIYYEYEVDEDAAGIKVSELEGNEQFDSNIRQNIMNAVGKDAIDAIKQYNISVKARYTGDNSGTTHVVTILD